MKLQDLAKVTTLQAQRTALLNDLDRALKGKITVTLGDVPVELKTVERAQGSIPAHSGHNPIYVGVDRGVEVSRSFTEDAIREMFGAPARRQGKSRAAEGWMSHTYFPSSRPTVSYDDKAMNDSVRQAVEADLRGRIANLNFELRRLGVSVDDVPDCAA